MMLSILLQAGRSAGLGAGFGGSSQTLFGAGGGTTFLAKFTATTAIIFVITSVGLAKISNRSGRELEEKAKKMSAITKHQKGTEVDLSKELGGKEEKAKEEKPAPQKMNEEKDEAAPSQEEGDRGNENVTGTEKEEISTKESAEESKEGKKDDSTNVKEAKKSTTVTKTEKNLAPQKSKKEGESSKQNATGAKPKEANPYE